MPTLLKKILSIIFFIFFAWCFSSPAKASYPDLQGQNPSETFKQALESDSMNYSQFSLISMDNIMMGLTKKMVDYPQLEGETANTSLLNSTGKAIAFLYTGQPSFVHYLAYEGQKLNLIKPVYAATGSGWAFLAGTPVNNVTLNIWTVSRNIAYLLFVVIFVIIGFMIMFRSKLNPQTVINIQLALPKIIIALIMVTFSYAFSGLIIDVVYLGNDLIRGIITTQSGTCTSSGAIRHLIFDRFIPTPPPGDPTIHVPWEYGCDSPPPMGAYTTPSVWPFDILGHYSSGGDTAAFFTDFFDLLLKALGHGALGNFTELFLLIISFSIIGASFKIFFSLLTKYVMIVLLTIFMPFSFLGTALSGQTNPVKPFKALLANTIAFPVTSFLLALAFFFAKVTSTGDLPPFYLSAWADAASASKITANLIAIGILLAIPTILASIDKVFESQPISQAASEQIAGGFRKIPIIGGMMG